MDLTSLIGPGLSLIGNLTNDTATNEQEATATPTVTPDLQAQIDAIFAKIPEIFGKEYPEYTGERVAGATESREAMDPFLDSLNNGTLQDRAQGINPYTDRINELMNMSPVQVQAPNLLGQTGGMGVTTTGGYNSADVASMPSTTADQYAPWMIGDTKGTI